MIKDILINSVPTFGKIEDLDKHVQDAIDAGATDYNTEIAGEKDMDGVWGNGIKFYKQLTEKEQAVEEIDKLEHQLLATRAHLEELLGEVKEIEDTSYDVDDLPF